MNDFFAIIILITLAVLGGAMILGAQQGNLGNLVSDQISCTFTTSDAVVLRHNSSDIVDMYRIDLSIKGQGNTFETETAFISKLTIQGIDSPVTNHRGIEIFDTAKEDYEFVTGSAVPTNSFLNLTSNNPSNEHGWAGARTDTGISTTLAHDTIHLKLYVEPSSSASSFCERGMGCRLYVSADIETKAGAMNTCIADNIFVRGNW